MVMKRRGAGFCTNEGCDACGKPFVLMDTTEGFECPGCMRRGRVECERAQRHTRDPLFSEVRIEYDYDASRAMYRRRFIAIEGRLLARQNIYTLQSPLITTEERAREVARGIMKTLNRRLLDGARRPPTHRQPSRKQLVTEGWALVDKEAAPIPMEPDAATQNG